MPRFPRAPDSHPPSHARPQTALGQTAASDAELHSALESSDGNVSQAFKTLQLPRSATATPTQATATTAAPPPVTPTTPQDSLVAELKSMFPALDSAIVALIVETRTAPAPGGLDAAGHTLGEDARLDKCIGDLLAMSDPEYKPEGAQQTDAQAVGPGVVLFAGMWSAHAPNGQAHVSLDEQFARSLAMQEQQAAPGYTSSGTQQQGNLPYQPRVRRSPAAQYEGEAHGYAAQGQGQHAPMVRPGGGRGGQQEPGVGDQFEEQFGKFAEGASVEWGQTIQWRM